MIEATLRTRLVRMSRLRMAFDNRWRRNGQVTLGELNRYRDWMRKATQRTYLAFIEWCRSSEYCQSKERELWPDTGDTQ